MTEAAPTTDYERFLAALPMDLREACESKLRGSGLAANHPVFLALAELYEKQNQQPHRDFELEAATHADLGQKLLDDFKSVPEAILARIEPQLLGLMTMFENPVAKLDVAATSLQRNVEALPIFLLGDRTPQDENHTETGPARLSSRPSIAFHDRLGQIFGHAFSVLGERKAWITSVIITFAFWFCVSATVLVLGSRHLSSAYDEAFQHRLAHMEADSVANTVTLNRLLAVGITIKVERGSGPDDWFVVLQGARKVVAPVDSPEGPAVEVRR